MKLDFSKINEVFISKGVLVQKLFVSTTGGLGGGSGSGEIVKFIMCKTSMSKKIFFIRVPDKYEIEASSPTSATAAPATHVEKIKKVETNTTQLNYIIESLDEIDTEQNYELISYSELSIDSLHDKKFESYIYDTYIDKLDTTSGGSGVTEAVVPQNKIDELIQKSISLSTPTPPSVVESVAPNESVATDSFGESSPVTEEPEEEKESEEEKDSGEESEKEEADEHGDITDFIDDVSVAEADLEEFQQLPEKTQIINKYTSSFYVCIEISKFLKNKERKFDEVDAEILSFTNNLNKKLSRMKEKRLRQVSDFFLNISKELEKKILEYKEQEIKINTDISKLSPHLLNAKTIINKNINESVKKEATELYTKISAEIEELNNKLQNIKDESSDLLSKFEIAIEKLK
jgi:hypothetical protein